MATVRFPGNDDAWIVPRRFKALLMLVFRVVNGYGGIVGTCFQQFDHVSLCNVWNPGASVAGSSLEWSCARAHDDSSTRWP